MPFGLRKSIPIIGKMVRLNVSKSGVSGTVKVGPWSWNTRQRRHRVDLPGPTYWQSRRQRGPSTASGFLRFIGVGLFIGLIAAVGGAALLGVWDASGLVDQARSWLGV
jgi:hypothetical protein